MTRYLGDIDLEKAKYSAQMRAGTIQVNVSQDQDAQTIEFYYDEVLSAIIFALQNGWMPDIGLRLVSSERAAECQ